MSGEHPTEPGECRDDVVFKAEVLSDEESAAVEHRFAATPAVAKRDSGLLVRRSGLLLRRSVGEAWRSERVMRLRSVLAYRTRQAPRDPARLVWFVFRGHSRWVGKAWTSFTYGDLRADARAARVAGDPEARRRAQELMRAGSRARWARVDIVIDRAGTAAWAMGAVGRALWLADSVMTRDEMWSWLAAVYSATTQPTTASAAIEHREFGAEAAALAVRVVKKARKCAITCLFLTQSPTAASIPKDLTRNCSNGVAFAVADQVANDGLLGSGKYRAGIRATELRPGEDRGTAVTVGLTANRFELVNTFYVPFEDGDDQVSPVIAHAMALLAEHGHSTPSSEPEPDNEESKPDHLADIQAVLRSQSRVRTQVVLARLAEHNPAEYADWTFQHLAADACLELELRTAGANTAGAWGGLSEQDRRALRPLWPGLRGEPISGLALMRCPSGAINIGLWAAC